MFAASTALRRFNHQGQREFPRTGPFLRLETETVSLALPEKTGVKREPPVEFRFQPGNAGRPKGSKNKLGEAFVAALHEDFQEHGARVIEAVRLEKPDVYLKVIAQIIPKELTIKSDTFGDITDEQLAAILAAARSALGIIDSSGEDITDAAGGKPSQDVQAISKAG